MKRPNLPNLFISLLVFGMITLFSQKGNSQSGIFTLNTNGIGSTTANSGVFSMGEIFVGSVSKNLYSVQGIIQPEGKTITNVMDVLGKTWEVTFYPNPTLNVIKIDTELDLKIIEVFNLAGQRILSIENKVDESINLTGLTQGSYILSVLTHDNQRLTLGRFIKL